MATHPIPSDGRDDSGFERLYRAHVQRVYRYAFSLTGNASDAEDVTQTTFLNAYRAYEAGQRPRAGENWLVTIAHNVCRQRARNSARRPHEVAFTEEIAEAPAPSPDAPTAADIRRAVRHLPADEQTVIAMRELQGRTNAEIASAVGLTTAATERLLFRARRSLRDQLTETLTCLEAEAAINRRLAGESSRHESAALRLHLRDCMRCASLARAHRAQGGLLGKIGTAAFPTSFLPASGLGAKVAIIAAAAAVSGGGYAAVHHAVTAPTVHHHVPAQAKPTVPVHRPTRPAAMHRASANHRLVPSPGSHPSAAHARTPSPPAKSASPPSDPPVAFHEPTMLAPPAPVDGDAGGGTEPASPTVEPTEEPKPTPAPPSPADPTTHAPAPQSQHAGLVAADHDPPQPPSPPPPATPAQGVPPTDPGSQSADHRVTPDPPSHP